MSSLKLYVFCILRDLVFKPLKTLLKSSLLVHGAHANLEWMSLNALDKLFSIWSLFCESHGTYKLSFGNGFFLRSNFYYLVNFVSK